MISIRFYIATLLLLCASTLHAAEPVKPIPVDEAFQFSAEVIDSQNIQLDWQITPGYFLYQDRFSYTVVEPNNAYLSDPILPKAIIKTDKYIGEYAVYNQPLQLILPVSIPQAGNITIDVNYQGCSDSGYCYPPTAKRVHLNLLLPGAVSQGKDIAPTPNIATPPPVPAASDITSETSVANEQDRITNLLSSNDLPLILLAFLGFGLLLTFTPCVLPMIPILSSIIIGHGKQISVGKAFRVSLVYVLSMSFTYAIAGVLAGFAGSTLQAAFQNPWVLGSFSVVFVLLAFSLFGFYEIKLPSAFENRLAKLSRKQEGGSYIGVAIMGCLATLIVSPCVTPALIGALAYIGQTGDATLGGLALFAMGLGMGIPLVILGSFGGKLLPKAGMWMNTVKAFFGVLMLAVAIWLISRFIPGQITLILWAVLLIISAIYMGALEPSGENGWRKLWKGFGVVFGIYGVILLIGASMGNTNPVHPLENNTLQPMAINTQSDTAFHVEKVKSIADLDKVLARAQQENKSVILDFYADWCISCQIIEKEIFENPAVQQHLTNSIVIQADVTANDATDKALEAHLGVFAPPTIVFFDKTGKEMPALRLVGDITKTQFLDNVAQLKVK